jgi:RecA-family ATPase
MPRPDGPRNQRRRRGGRSPDLTGISSGSGNSGSTGWPGAFRSHLYLEIPKRGKDEEPADPNATDERVLTRKKSNWARAGETIEIRLRDGAFINKNPPTGILGSIERRTAEGVFLELVDVTTQEGQPVSANSRAGNYAPRVFAMRPPYERENFRRADFERAMQALFARREITAEEYGRKGDARRRIVPVIAAKAATE